MYRFWPAICLLLAVGFGDSASSDTPKPRAQDAAAPEEQQQETAKADSGNKAEEEQELTFATPEELGKHLFLALREQDEEQYLGTCATMKDLEQIIDTISFLDEETRQKELEALKKHFEALPKSWKADYRKAQEIATKMGISWQNTTLISVKLDTDVKKEMGVEVFSSMTMRFSCTDHPGKVFAIRMDDGVKFGKTWLFTDDMLRNIHLEPK